MGEERVSREDKKALKAALRLLRFRPRSTWELTTRLRQKFNEKTRRHVIQSLQTKRLLDDHAFAKFWIENRLRFKPLGRARLFRELLAKGIDRGVIQEVLDAIHPGGDRIMAERLFVARRRKMDLKDPKNYQRMYRFLRNRGFAHELVSDLLEKDVHEDDG